MSKQWIYRAVSLLGFVGFGLVMARRPATPTIAVRIGVAVLAGVCLGVAVLLVGKANHPNDPSGGASG